MFSMRFWAFTGVRLFLAVSVLFAGSTANRGFDYRKKDPAEEILKTGSFSLVKLIPNFIRPERFS
jgi:hypothetical protein